MKTFLKILSGLVIIAVVAVAGFIFTFDANSHKEEITEALESVTGRDINIAGDMDISLYPWIGIKVNELTIRNKPGFSNETFATVGQFDVSIKIIPLLQKRLEVDRLVLHRLSANFETNAMGENNWSDISGQTESGEVESRFGLAGLVLGGIDLKDASMTWLDSNTGQEYKISKLSLSAQAISNNQPLPVEMKGIVENNQPGWMAAVNAKAKLVFNSDGAVIDANELKLTAKALLPESEMGSLKIAMVADSRINLQSRTARLSNARLGLLGLVVAGDLDIENIFTVPRIHGPVKVKAFEAQQLADNIGFHMPPLANTESLKNISLTALFDTDFDTLKLDNIVAKVDQSRVEGFVYISGFAPPVVQYELMADRINLDDYRIAGDAEEKADLPLPYEFIRTAELEGVLDIAAATMNDTELDELNIITSIDDGIFNAGPISMRVHEGEVLAELQLDVRDTLDVVLKADVKQVDAASSINPLIQGVIGEHAPVLSGPVDADISLKATGTSLAGLKSSALGTISINMKKGAIKGIDFNYASQSVVVEYADRNNFRVSRTFNDEYVPDSVTEFDRLRATFNIAKRKLVNKDLLIASEHVKVTGSGSIDFDSGKVDYRPVIDMNVKSSANVRDKLRDHPMEYHAHGSLGDLACEFNTEKYDLHLGRLMIQQARAHRNRQVNKKSQGTWTNVMSK